MRGLDLAVGFLLLARPLHGTQLFLGKDEVLLRGFGFQGFQPFAKRFQIVPQPDAAHSRRRSEPTVLGQFVGHAHLAEGRLLQGDLDHRSSTASNRPSAITPQTS